MLFHASSVPIKEHGCSRRLVVSLQAHPCLACEQVGPDGMEQGAGQAGGDPFAVQIFPRQKSMVSNLLCT